MKKILFNFLYNALYQILLILLPLVTTPYLSRVFSPETLGQYSYCFTIASTFALFGVVGMNNYGNRRVAETRNDDTLLGKSFTEIYIVQLFFAVATIIVYFIYTFYFSKYRKLALLLSFSVISTVFDINWLFFGIEKFKITVTRNFIIKLSLVSMIFVCVKREQDIYAYTAIMSVMNLISHLAIWPYLKKNVKLQKVKLRDCLQHVKPSLVLFVPILAQYMYKNMDRIMLGKWSSMRQVGLYSNADKIAVMPIGVITALGTVMLPYLSNLYANREKNKANEYLKYSMRLSNFLSIGMAFGLAAISKELIPVFLGDNYIDCTGILAALSSLAIFVSWSNVISTQHLMPSHRDRIYVHGVCLGVLINAVINALLIGKFGAIGATIGTIVAEFAVSLYLSYKVRRELPICLFIRQCVIFCVSAVIMYWSIRLFAYYSPYFRMKFAVEIVLGAFVYISINVVYVAVFDKELRQLIKKHKYKRKE